MRMIHAIAFVFSLATAFATLGHAVQSGSGFDTTPPTSTDIPNWNTGWGSDSVTGWDYVGQVNDASGTYLGNGWVLTAGHVGEGDFTLNGVTYDSTGPAYNITVGSSTVDLTLFQIANAPALPALTLSMTDPTALAYGTPGSQVVMIGYGGGAGKTWGLNTITQVNQSITPDGMSYVSNDFLTYTGNFTVYNSDHTDSQTIYNPAQLVGGDSGGGDFIYNATTGTWELAGINEVMGNDDVTNQPLSGSVQVDTYAAEIEDIMATATPEPPLGLLLGMGCCSIWGVMRWRQRKKSA